MSSGSSWDANVIRPSVMLRGRTAKPRHFAFGSATRSGQQRTREVGPVVYLTHEVSDHAVRRRVEIATLDERISFEPRPPKARFFSANKAGLEISVCTDQWLPWSVASKACSLAIQGCASEIQADLTADYALVEAVSAHHPADLCVAVLEAADPHDGPGFVPAIREALSRPREPLEPTALSRSLDRLGLASPTEGNRRSACDRLLLVALARAFAGPTPPLAAPPWPSRIDTLVDHADLVHGGAAERFVQAAIRA